MKTKNTFDLKQYPTIDAHGHLFVYPGDEVNNALRDKGMMFFDKQGCGCETKWFMDKKLREADMPRPVDEYLFSPEKRLELMDHYHIDKQVLLPLPQVYENSGDSSLTISYHQKHNESFAEIGGKFDRFIPFAVVPMQNPTFAIDELRRCKEQLDLQGVEINTLINGKSLSHSDYLSIWEAISDLNMSVFIHPWNMADPKDNWNQHMSEMPNLNQKAMSSLIDGGILEKFPNLRVMVAHGGGNYFWNLPRIEVGKNSRPDLFKRTGYYKSDTEDFEPHVWVDSNVFDKDNLELIINRMGKNGKMSLGTDCPFPLGSASSEDFEADYPQRIIEEANLTGKQKKDILLHNTLSWLNLGEEDFLESLN